MTNTTFSPQILIGDFLKQKREDSGLSLAAIAQRTKINLTILKNLEENQFESLPNQTYLKGFVKAYAKEVGIPEKQALQALSYSFGNFQEVQEEEDVVNEQVVSSENNEPGPQELFAKLESLFKQISPQHLKVVLALGGAGIFALFIFFQISSINKEPNKELTKKENKEEVTKPAKTTPVPEVVKEQKKIEEKEVEKIVEATPTPAPTPETVIKEEPKKIAKAEDITNEEDKEVEEKKEEVIRPKYKLADGSKVTLMKQYDFFKLKLPLYEPTELTEDAGEFLPSNFKNATVDGNQNVLINAVSGDSWIAYKKDSEPVKHFVLRKDKKVFISAEELRLFIANLGVLKVFLNNKPLNISSTNGVKSLVFPQDNSDSYRIPLFVREISGQFLTSDLILKAEKIEE